MVCISDTVDSNSVFNIAFTKKEEDLLVMFWITFIIQITPKLTFVCKISSELSGFF